MLPRRCNALLALRPTRHVARLQPSHMQLRWASNSDPEDPDMNGGYINPPREKRQFRDPYGDWWDKQERRNYGETLHEDDDILGMMGPEEEKHFTVAKTIFLWLCLGTTLATAGTLLYSVRPERPAVRRGFEGGLERELGGPGAVRARTEEESWVESLK